MNNTECFFVTILSDYIQKRDTISKEDIHWEEICRLAQLHEVEGIVYHQCKNISYLSRLQQKYASTMFFYANRKKVMADMRKTLYENGIPLFTVKGMDVAALYPVPALRSMGDLDMVMHTDDREKAIPVMESLGFSLDKKDYEYHYSKGSMIIEVHDHLVYDHFVKKSDKREYYEKCWEYVHKNEQGYDELDWNLHFIFLLEHLRQHLTAHGVGMRQFMDIAVVTQASDQLGLDWQWIESELIKIQMYEFAKTILTFCQDWFDVLSPFPHAEFSQAEKEKCLQVILRNGVFGFANEDHDINNVGKRINEISGPAFLRPTRYALKRIFLPYDAMIELPYCAFLENRWYLLPFAWFYRIVYRLVHTGELVRDTIGQVFLNSNKLSEREEQMRIWGIDKE